MQRLTIRNSDGSVSQPTDTTFEKAMYQLASYEDLGYTPSELKAILDAKQDRIDVDIDHLDTDHGRFRASATVRINGQYAVHHVRVLETQKGLTVVMPTIRRQTESGPVPMDAFHALNANASERIRESVLQAYHAALSNSANIPDMV